MAKEIYGALEISNHEVRLIVGEYYNTRFNIIRVEREMHSALCEFSIINKEELKEAIINLIDRASNKIGVKIERLLLLIPTVNFKRYPLKVGVHTQSGIVTKNDIARAIKKAMKTTIDNTILIINAVCVKYTCNGISSRRIPEREVTDDLVVDIDLLCADKTITFDYVSLVEECGIEVMDISLDMYSICKEAALFEQTVNQNLILLKVEEDTTSLALISKGKLVNCDVLYEGLNNFNNIVFNKYHLRLDIIENLIKYNVSLDLNEVAKTAIYAWKDAEGKSHSITGLDLSNLLKESLNIYVQKIKNTCEPILESGDTSMVVVAEGAKMKALIDLLSQKLDISIKTYHPETIGARDSSLTALLGSIYGYRDFNQIEGNIISSVDLYALNELIDKKVNDTEGETLTTRIKNLFDSKKKEVI